MSNYNLEGAHEAKSRLGVRGVLAIFGGIIMLVPVGTAYILGNYSPYIISYLRNRTDDTSLRNVDGLWLMATGSVSQCFGATIGGLLDRAAGAKIAVGIGSLVFSGTVLFSFLFIKISYVWVVISYALVNSVGAKIVYGLCVQTAMKWLPHRSSMAAGIILSGYGAGGLVFNQIITLIINPDNLTPDLETDDGERYFTDPDVLDRVPLSFLYLGGIFLALQVIGTILFSTPPEKTETIRTISIDQNGQATELQNDKLSTVSEQINFAFDKSLEMIADGKENDGNLKSKREEKEPSKTPSEKDSVKDVVLGVLKTRSFHIVFITVLCFSWSIRLAFSLYKAYGQTFIHDDRFLALCGTLSSVFNSLGRPVWGSFMDKFGFKMTIRCISVGVTAICATLFLTEHMHKAAFMVWVCAVLGVYSGIWAVCPSTFAKLYGVENTAINYSFLFLAAAIASVATLVIGTALKDIIGYHGIFFISAGLSAIPFPLTFFFNGVDKEGKMI